MVRLLDIIACVGFIAGLIALPFSFYYFRRAPIRSALVFAVPLLIFMAAVSTSQSWAQGLVLDALGRCSPDNSTVLIDGHEISNRPEILSTLRELREVPAHHSSPSRRFSVDVRGPAPLSLILARDSGDPREYWVFYPKYWITRHNEIGRIKTPIFDAY